MINYERNNAKKKNLTHMQHISFLSTEVCEKFIIALLPWLTELVNEVIGEKTEENPKIEKIIKEGESNMFKFSLVIIGISTWFMKQWFVFSKYLLPLLTKLLKKTQYIEVADIILKMIYSGINYRAINRKEKRKRKVSKTEKKEEMLLPNECISNNDIFFPNYFFL
jgi:hypothetical protein